jgi:hypothetical protein
MARCSNIRHVDNATMLPQLLNQLVLLFSQSVVLTGHYDSLGQLLDQVCLPHSLLFAVDGKSIVVNPAKPAAFDRL